MNEGDITVVPGLIRDRWPGRAHLSARLDCEVSPEAPPTVPDQVRDDEGVIRVAPTMVAPADWTLAAARALQGARDEERHA